MSQRGGAGGATVTPGALFELVRTGGPYTRAQLLERTGLSRGALAHHVDLLVERGFLVERPGRSTGGRPPAEVAFDPGAGLVLTAWLGRTRCGVAVVDLGAELLTADVLDVSLDRGPEVVLDAIERACTDLRRALGREDVGLRGVGLGVPWPVEPDATAAVPAEVAPEWHGFVLNPAVERRFGAPAMVDKDANLAALAEYRQNWQGQARDVIFLKAGASIGCGIVSGGVLQRGAQGSAGELGHVWVGAAAEQPCPCGNRGCLDTIASGFALARRLAEAGRPAADGRDVVRLAKTGDSEAIRILRDAGRALGEAVAATVNLLNPAVIVVGGDLAASDELLAGTREGVYQRATARSTRTLRIVRSQLGEPAGLVGPAIAVLDTVLAPAAVDALLDATPTPTPVPA